MEHAERMLAPLDRAGVGLTKRLLHRLATDGASVQNHKLLKPVTASLPRTRKKPGKPEAPPLKVPVSREPRQQAVAKQVPNAHGQALCAGQRGHRTTVAAPLEGNRWPREGDALQAMHDVSRLRLLAPQEFAARGKIVEKVAPLDVRSCRRANFPNGLDPASANHHFGPAI